MKDLLYSMGGILIPFLGTSIGSAFVFFMKKNLNEKFQKLLVGSAAGVMIAASVWSLIIPSVEMAEEQGVISWLPATIGFLLGVVFLLGINEMTEKITRRNHGKKINMLMFSVTLHNIPEGMAVGVCFAGFLLGNAGVTLAAAMVLSIRNCYSKYSRRSNYFYAYENEWRGKMEVFLVWSFIRSCGANCCTYDIITD